MKRNLKVTTKKTKGGTPIDQVVKHPHKIVNNSDFVKAIMKKYPKTMKKLGE